MITRYSAITQLAMFSVFLSIISLVACDEVERNDLAGETTGFPELTGPYLGQPLPGSEPQLFAPGIVCDGLHNRDMAITLDGSEIFFTSHVSYFIYSAILQTKLVDGVWTKPEVAPFSIDARYVYAEPHISPDGKHLFFLSNRAAEEGGEKNEDIWVVDRIEDGWGEPYDLGEPICSDADEYFPSVTRDGTIYFTRSEPRSESKILRSKLVDGQYQEPELLPEQVNCGENRFNAFISPDEKYLILGVAGMPDSRGGIDYYVVFRDENDNWSDPVNLGDKINSDSNNEFSPYVSPDGKYFFFMSSRLMDEAMRPKTLSIQTLRDIQDSPMMGSTDIFWVEADFIVKLRPVAN